MIASTNLHDSFSCLESQVCCRVDLSSSFNNDLIKCGKSRYNSVHGRIHYTKDILNSDSEFGEFPWQGAILDRVNSELKFVCGATLIDDRHLLSATHCVDR